MLCITHSKIYLYYLIFFDVLLEGVINFFFNTNYQVLFCFGVTKPISFKLKSMCVRIFYLQNYIINAFQSNSLFYPSVDQVTIGEILKN